MNIPKELMYTKDHGYVKGISNIFVKQLQDMKPTERPIHCSDTKKLQFYVKDEDMWNEDDEHEKIDKIIIGEIKIVLCVRNNIDFLQKQALLLRLLKSLVTQFYSWHIAISAFLCTLCVSADLRKSPLSSL